MGNKVNTKNITCNSHGDQDPAYICQHLLEEGNNSPIGFYQPKERFNDVQAWCKKCDNELEKAGWEWNDENEAYSDIKLICYQCFLNIKMKQIKFNSNIVQLDDERIPDDDEFYDLADKFIDLANKQSEEFEISEIGDSFIYAVSRYNAFEAVITEENLDGNRQKIIESYCNQYRMSLIDNLKEYENNKGEYSST